ncbi:MAG: hypothetical protein HZC37_14610 [Burkholderiales bacterium]|nr:hypothetical protein [Burkholderiales bacterium]
MHAPPGAARKAWRAAFDEDLLAPHSPAEVARWALRHGSSQRPGPADALAREVEPRMGGPGARGRAVASGATVARLWVYTAAIDFGAQRVRVLVSPLDMRRVLGPRLVGRGRLGVLAGTLAAGLVAGVALWRPGLGSGQAPAAQALPGASASVTPMAASSPAAVAIARPMAMAAWPDPAAAAAPTLAASPAPTGHAPSGPQTGRPSPSTAAAASASATSATSTTSTTSAAPATATATAATTPSTATTASTAAAPASAHPGTPGAEAGVAPSVATAQAGPASAAATPLRPVPGAGESRLRPLAPPLAEEVRRAAREASEAARNERALRLAERAPAASVADARDGVHPHTGPSLAAAAPPRPDAAGRSPAVAPPAVAWAVSTRNLRTRFESEQMLAALRDVAYRGGHGNELKLEVLPSGDDWRAVGWPFATRADAERLRAAMAARGLKAEVVQF